MKFIFKNAEDYKTQREALLNKAQELLNNGDIDGGNVEMEKITEMDNAYDAFAKSQVDNNSVDSIPSTAGVVNYVGRKLNEKLDKPSLIQPTRNTLLLNHNQEAQFEELAELTILMPDSIDELYWSSFCFACGTEPTSIAYPSEPIIWVGDDSDSEGNFVPEPNTRYEIGIKKLGNDIVARVGAY